ncbi:uncharacterized protein buc2l [Eucyclogobius newberryi]|uniref:uncharacterized protein buc2l n=1 Tax=Eucyclogobius newberryi TaxID=166745 RepID=UPI003B5B8C44
MDPFTVNQQQPYVPGPSTTHGPGQSHGPGVAPGPGAAPGPGPHTHHKPFFYVQPPQPQFLPVQWPLPLAVPLNYGPNYGPYYGGFPGFGFGFPLMPHFPPAPYVEAPGFVMPHTHHHLMDYRRMLNPHYYQSMAYHSRRLRYQQNVPARDVTSCQVQTEPFPPAQCTGSNPSETSKDSANLSTAASVQKDDGTLALNELAPATPNATPQKSGFVIETSEVRIECRASPAGLQVLHETSELSRRFAQDVVHCSSIVQNSSIADENLPIVNAESENDKSPQPCRDILLIVSPSANDESAESETTLTNRSRIKTAAEVEAMRNSKNLKVVRLPFNAKYLAELQRNECSVWSMDDTLVPSPEYIMDSCNEALPREVPSTEMLITRKENVQDKVVPIAHLPETMSEELEDIVPTFERPIVESQSHEVSKRAYVYSQISPKSSQNLLSDDSPLDVNLQDHQDTSFESLPAYLPSASWLADFESVRYRRMPPTPQKLNKQTFSRSFDVPERRRKLDAEFKEATAIRKPKERYKPKGKADRRSLSDHECCVGRSFNENSFASRATKGQRLCTRCLSKQRMYKTSTSPAQVPKRKATPFQAWNEAILPTCDACKGHADKRFARKGSSPDARMEMDGELSENGYKWRLLEEMRREMKRPPASKRPNRAEKSSGSYSKARERGCACGEPPQSQWHRIYHCPHGNAIRGTDENCAAASSQELGAHTWQTEKLWKSTPGRNVESLKNDLTRAHHLNLHKKSLPLSQGTHRKDTRC